MEILSSSELFKFLDFSALACKCLDTRRLYRLVPGGSRFSHSCPAIFAWFQTV